MPRPAPINTVIIGWGAHPRGSSKMKIKKGTKGGSVLRMKGKGVQTDEGRLGDQLVRISIGIPKKLSKEEKEYLKRFEDIFD